MGLFSRNRGTKRAHRSEDGVPSDYQGDSRTALQTGIQDTVVDAVDIAENNQGHGPYNGLSEAPDVDYLDFGSLMFASIAGANVQVVTDPQQRVVMGVMWVKPRSAVQLQAFAAPKSRGIWDDVRADMVNQIAEAQGRSHIEDGTFGKEIRSEFPTPQQHVVSHVRYIGFDGPRWYLRVTVTGDDALNIAEGDAFVRTVLDHTVVVRGNEAHPPRELLPLRLPIAQAEGSRSSSADADGREKLLPPQKGPEITEVR
ncbi:MAG: DUF3710 domain-containing protein [Actinomycetaceae bacterium]|nr:DUF3710 domain-containing protein [Actinomycetaceae bacterium]MDY6083092.1 DUF3710 domain-containing protein [Actinomycetaceae bacterium]